MNNRLITEEARERLQRCPSYLERQHAAAECRREKREKAAIEFNKRQKCTTS